MVNRHSDLKVILVVVLGIILLISLLLARPVVSNTNITIGNIGLPKDAVNELKKLLSH